MEIAGHLALVTGGGSGLGAATARYLAAKGAEVAILDFDDARAQAVATEIGARAYKVDVADAASVAEGVGQAVADARGNLRVAVNCAGVANAARVVGRDGTPSTALFEHVIRVNLIGSFNVMAHAVAEMRKLDSLAGGERGVVVNTSSAAWQDGQVGQAAYAASKGGIAAMSLPVARDLARDGIRCMAIAPGLFRTPMMEALPEETTAAITANIPFPARLGDPAEFALMVTQIIENPYLNGTTIRLDGATRLPAR